ncbi:MAG: NYN domain-containing protein [Clostridia bacterium]|nr:NYN domain-containing protein [Clostridia bacterium]
MNDNLIYKPVTAIDEKASELRTVVFIDYEAYFWGLYNEHGEKPDLASFINDVKKRGNIEKIKVFGDFSKPEIECELDKIRTITSDITNCNNPNRFSKKDYADFIMLDHIYQTELSQPDLQQYILVTGDGHFSSVATFLKTYKDKIVGIYGVEGSLSKQLVNCASWGIEIQPDAGCVGCDYQINLLRDIMDAEQKDFCPFFRQTVEHVSRNNPDDKLKYTSVLSKLIQDGYIYQIARTLADGRTVNVLVPDWAFINRSGLMNGAAA